MGEYILTGTDVLEVENFGCDGRCAYSLDIHNPKGKGTRIERLPRVNLMISNAFLIPLTVIICLLPAAVFRGLTKHIPSYRIMPAAGYGAGSGVLCRYLCPEPD